MATGQYNSFPIDWKSIDATKVPYSNSASGLTATDVQNAIDELNTDLNAIDASDIPYDNTASGLTADDVQEALDELASEKQDTLTAGDGIDITSDVISVETDSALTSATLPANAKAVGDALASIGETLKADFAPVITDTASGAIASFPDGADGYPLKECVVDVDAVQDLHGYDNPWPAGGGKNKLPPLPTQTKNGFTITNDDGVLTFSGRTTADSDFTETISLKAGTYNICALNTATSSRVRLYISDNGTNIVNMYINSANRNVGFTIEEDKTLTFGIFVQNSTAGSPIIISPQITSGSGSDLVFAPYSNICPITGWSSAKVTRTGKNLFDKDNYNSVNGFISDQHRIIDNQYATSVYIPCKPNTTYTVSKIASARFSVAYSQDVPAISVTTGGEIINPSATSLTITTGANANYLIVFCHLSTADTLTLQQVLDTLQIEVGSAESAYEPYNGQTVTISIGDTRYGAVLDVTRGKLRVTWASVDLGSLSGWAKTADTASIFYVQVPNMKLAPTLADRATGILCSQYKPSSVIRIDANMNDKSMLRASSGNATINIRDTSYESNTPTEFKTAMNGVQLVYELATPVEVDLTPTEITTLLGTNCIFASTGDVSVTYGCDTRKFLEKIIASL